MSVDYDLVCHKHKERVSAATDGLSGRHMNCNDGIAVFCINHRNCDIHISDENDEQTEEYKEINYDTEVDYGLD